MPSPAPLLYPFLTPSSSSSSSSGDPGFSLEAVFIQNRNQRSRRTKPFLRSKHHIAPRAFPRPTLLCSLQHLSMYISLPASLFLSHSLSLFFPFSTSYMLVCCLRFRIHICIFLCPLFGRVHANLCIPL